MKKRLIVVVFRPFAPGFYLSTLFTASLGIAGILQLATLAWLIPLRESRGYNTST